MTTLRAAVSRIALYGMIAMTGCASPGESLQRLLEDEHYAEAYALLLENGVGGEDASGAEAEALDLRTTYTEQIESSTELLIGRLLDQGEAHSALATAHERNALCPWSSAISALVTRCEDCVQRIQETEARWSGQLRADSDNLVAARTFLSEIDPHRPWILDSSGMRALEQTAANALIHGWALKIAAAVGRLSPSELVELQADLGRVGVGTEALKEVESPLSLLARLPRASDSSVRLGSDGVQAVRAVRMALVSGPSVSRSRLEPCASAAWRAIENWILSDFAQILANDGVEFLEIAEGEALLELRQFNGAIRPSVAQAHVNCAVRHAPHGISSVLSLLHLERAQFLAGADADADWESVRRLAEATFAATPSPYLQLEVELGPKVLPEVRGLVATSLMAGLRAEDEALSKVMFEQVSDEAPKLTLALELGELVADVDDLHTVTSSYFSHFENIPNPEKDSLRIRLDIAESNVNAKERAYDWAVNAHNAYPTDYSLINANTAFSAYQYAINHYNSLVNLYNATPSTISNAVYLPYSFRQGEIRFGWRLAGEVRTSRGRITRLATDSVVRDFVRFGNKGTDANESYRRADDLDIDIGPVAAMNHLERALEQAKSTLYPLLAQLTADAAAELEPEERIILGWLLHPWGTESADLAGLGIPAWAKEAARSLKLERPAVSPPTLAIERSEVLRPTPLNAEEAAVGLGPYVCQIKSSTADRTASGTATLIGPAGLMLTCAHVILGQQVEVEFPQGSWSGSYSAEVIFVNAERDVALIRASGLNNGTWADLRMDSTTAAGELIVAIGNPGMDVGGTNKGGISQGIVSNARLERGQSIYLAADIAIAQGSSGGPIFSLKTGELIGVVQMVATSPGFPTAAGQVAATGYLCLAAPSQELSIWLGLTRNN